MIKSERVRLFNMPTLVNPQGFILTNIASTEEYIKHKYSSSLRRMNVKNKKWLEEDNRQPIYKSPLISKLDIRKLRNDNNNSVFEVAKLQKIQTIEELKEQLVPSMSLPYIDKKMLNLAQLSPVVNNNMKSVWNNKSHKKEIPEMEKLLLPSIKKSVGCKQTNSDRFVIRSRNNPHFIDIKFSIKRMGVK